MAIIGNPIISTDFPKDKFSGNGSTTAFTMSIAPASVNSVLVIVSGITQDPSTYTISGTTLTFSGAPPTGTSNISVRHLGVAGIPNTPSAASVVTASIADANVTTAKIADANVTTAKIADSSVTYAKLSSDLQRSGMKNRLINGNMVIDQRNAGASTTTVGYTVDRWAYYSNQTGKLSFQQSTDAPSGFYNSVKVTSTSAYSVGSGDRFIYSQNIEGVNTSDIAYGTANALTTTLSFWVKSSLTGTFACSLNNSAGTYSYVTTYSIPVANTWTKISLTIPPVTSGSWNNGTNSLSICLNFDLGSGSTFTTSTLNTWQNAFYENATGAVALPSTNGATWYVTGVQFEIGSTATGFEYRQYGTELQLCQRYFERSYDTTSATGSFSAGWRGTCTNPTAFSEGPAWMFAVPKRTGPTVTLYQAVSGAAGYAYQVSTAASIAVSLRYVGQTGIGIIDYTSSGGANSYWIHFTASAEL